MKKIVKILILCLFVFCNSSLFAQEALKSIEEEYYDFLSLTGVVERPTLGYRTLSDSVWKKNPAKDNEEAEENDASDIWKNNNLGTIFTLWQSSSPAENWFAEGLKQGLTARVYGPEWYNSYNTKVPYGQNDGALWQGCGYNTSFSTGFRLEGYGFELTFKPQISWNQNKEFEVNKNIYPNPYSYSFHTSIINHNIDYVQRYGDSSFWNFDLGDTEVRWTLHSLTFGFGTQNPWLGPAYLNPMLGSNNAPGYLKFDAGLRKTKITLPFLDWNLGYIEGRIWVGQLKESDYFDYGKTHENRMLTAMSASYNPSFIPGFTIGLNRIFITYWRPENIKYILRLFTASRSNALSSSGNDEDQKFSIFADWYFPKVGFTIYGEFGRDDFSSNEKSNPFHTAIYTVGAKQSIPLHLTKLFHSLPNSFDLESELVFEWNNFEMSQDFQLQWSYLGYYAHGFVSQGYTHKGQILGAGSGAFGNSQLLQYKIFYPIGYTLLKFHRYCPNNNSVLSHGVYTTSTNEQIYDTWYATYETYLVYGLENCLFIKSNFEFTVGFNIIKIYHKNYIKNNDDNSFNGNITIKYNF